MSIKGIHDRYQIQKAGGLDRPYVQREKDGASASKDSTAPKGDVIDISAGGSFKARLDAEVKRMSQQLESAPQTSTARIAQLREQYSGDNCPLSSNDIAAAVLEKVCGIVAKPM